MEEKDYIEKLILEYQDEINNEEPAEGHFERFEEKLRKLGRERKFNFSIVWKVAAAVVFIFLAVNQAIIWLSPNESNITLSSISPEYREAEFYYTSAINEGLSQWEQLNKAGLITATENEMMNNELQEFENIHKNLQEELKANPYDERVINAMLEYYQTKLSIISMVVEKLKEAKSKNNTKHEIEM